MIGGQIVVEENGIGDRSDIRRLRLRLRGVRMGTISSDPASELYVTYGDSVLYFPGSGTFTVNGIIVIEQDLSYDTTYTAGGPPQ